MKSKPFGHFIILYSLLAIFITGQAGAKDLIWCLCENGSMAFQFSPGVSCSPAKHASGNHCHDEQEVGYSTCDDHCGSCLDIRLTTDVVSGRLRNHHVFWDQVVVSHQMELFSLSPIRYSGRGEYSEPLSRVNETLQMIDTVVLTI